MFGIEKGMFGGEAECEVKRESSVKSGVKFRVKLGVKSGC